MFFFCETSIYRPVTTRREQQCAVVDSLVGFGIDREGIRAGWDFWDWTRVRRKLERGMKEGGPYVLCYQSVSPYSLFLFWLQGFRPQLREPFYVFFGVRTSFTSFGGFCYYYSQ